MEESDSLLMIPMENLANRDSQNSKDQNKETFHGEKVPNVKQDTDDEVEEEVLQHDILSNTVSSHQITNDDHDESNPNLNNSTDAQTSINGPMDDVCSSTAIDIEQPQSPAPPPDVIPNQDAIPASPGENNNTTYTLNRVDSRTSFANSINLDLEVCRICHCESEPGAPLISPCVCSGTLKFVHQSCLQQWIKSADTKSCELCKFDFTMTTKIKPFRKWQKLEMSTVERRKIMCSVTFHIIAITCVIWSLYVLIDKTTQEIRQGLLEWPFWTKLIVVAIGFTGGLVFMYVQCKMYVQLCRRWRAYNRVIYIQNLPVYIPVYTQSKLNNSTNNQTSLFGETDLL